MTRKKLESQVGVELAQRELYSPIYATADPNSLCFPEWLDEEVSAERWDPDDKAFQLYEDPQTVLLPPSLLGHEWQRPAKIFPQAEFMIYVDKPVYPDLIARSHHLLESEFVRSFISSVEILCYLGNCRKFSSEYTSPVYVANTADKPWRPWHHVYSKCRAGKGEKHTPSVNKSGKYIVRIFWMGCWRKVYVDDSLPLNSSNELLLPSLMEPTEVTSLPTSPSSSKAITREQSSLGKPILKTEHTDLKKTRIRESYVVEIWPFLLAKALMKVASLTWTKDEELKDFDIIQCLTGWIPYKMYTKGLDPLKVWDFCMEHTTKFQWTEERPKETKKKKSPVKVPEEDQNAFKGDCYLTLCYNKVDQKRSTSHSFLIDQTRDIPLVKPSKISDFPVWKRFRWLDWAIENNLISPLESTVPIRCFKTVDPFRRAYDNIVDENLGVTLPTDESIASKSHYENRSSARSSGEGKSKSKIDSKSKDKGKVIADPMPDISKWTDFDQVSEHMEYLTVYYKPSKFNVKVRISNIICENIQKEARQHPAKKLEDTLLPNWKEIIIPETLQIYRNEPYHFFRDSLTSQTVIINLTQTGHQPVLAKLIENDESKKIEESGSECGLCSSTLLQRVMKNVKKKQQECKKVKKIVEFPLNSEHDRPEANLVIVKCRWTNDQKDNIVDSLVTSGSGSIVLELRPGRELFSVFMKTESSYVTQILSDGALCVGTMEEIYPLMAEESRTLECIAKAVAKSFETLIKSFGKPDFQAKLREYYCSYKPSNGTLDKYELKTVHETFYDELYKLVQINMGEDERAALKILFRKVQLARGEHVSVSTFCYPVNEEEMEYVDVMNKAAIVIQSFFRGCYERSLLRRHRTADKHHKSIAACLNAINSTLFPNKGGLNLGTTLLRNFLNNDSIYDFREKYQCFEDNQNTITIYQFPNSAKTIQRKWTVLDRQVFFVSSYTPLVIRAEVFCDISKYVVRVFDNDSGREVKIFTNNVAVGEYLHNYNGYTIICYGWPTSDTVMFKLVFAVSKGEDANSLTFSGVPTKSEVIRGNYIPNTNRLICEYQILVKSVYVLLTVRFMADFPEVKLLLRLYHQSGSLVKEAFGEGAALIPAVMLENNEEGIFKKMGYTDSIKSVNKKMSKSKMNKGHRSRKASVEESIIIPDIYFIEAYVVNDSWPLTANEWRIVEKLREKMLVGDGITSMKGNNDNFPSANREFVNQSPSWTMEMIYNVGDAVKFVRDEKKEAEIWKTKMRWYGQDPSRYGRSQELRNDFLEKNVTSNPDFRESLSERSLHPQIFQPEVILPYDVTPFLLEPTVVKRGAERELKTVEDLSEDSTNELNRIIEFSSYQTNCLAEMDQLLDKQVEKYNLLDNWYNDCRQESNLLMESAYALREKYIQHATEATAAAQKAAKRGKKEKVSKKM